MKEIPGNTLCSIRLTQFDEPVFEMGRVKSMNEDGTYNLYFEWGGIDNVKRSRLKIIHEK